MARHPEPTGPGYRELLRFGFLLGALPLVFSPIYMLWKPYDAITGNVLAAPDLGRLVGVVVDTVVYSYRVALLPTTTDRPGTFVESFPTLVESATVVGLLVVLLVAVYQYNQSDELR